MKRQVQSPGVRKWFGDDWINIQDEILAVLEGFFGDYEQQFILTGCEVNGSDIGAGIVGLIDGNGFHLCRFAGAQGVAWPVYFHPEKVIENREYLDLEAKPVTETWQVATNNADGGGYFQLKQDGTSARFADAIQTSTRQFVTDAEKASYAGQASAAIATLRDGVAEQYNTLAKIAAAMLLADSPTFTGVPTAPTAAQGTNTTQLATTAFVAAALAALVDSSPATLDTLNELAAALGDDPNFATTMTNALAGKCAADDPRLSNARTPIDNSVSTDKLANRYKSRIAPAGSDIDFSVAQVFPITLLTNTTLSFSNIYIGAVKDIEVTGDYTLGLPTWLKIISGEYDGTVPNLLQVKITNDQAGSESGWCTISQEVV
ncbi:hypothetical protein [uncultured Draconibacterium sp.]|uniref:hypothetical protein n=1 Tax=uncultured Draconibacterium sp. TaxID=1573823 RepID=UPI0025E4C83D|nr:hypothetical protein [uncultured Draconibacterium sp.]